MSALDDAPLSAPPARADCSGGGLRPLRLGGLRAWMLIVLTAAVLSAPTFLDIALPLAPLLTVLALLALFTFLSLKQPDGTERSAPEIALQLGVDLVGLGVLLYLSGGASNPLVSLLLYPVVAAALSLPTRWVAAVTALAIGVYSFLMVYFLPLPIADVARATRLHLGGMWLTFVVSAALAAWFIARMTASIRQRDAQLAAAREQALRHAQVVALGQLAAGAAHELGTPLATINVIVGELQRDAQFDRGTQADLALLKQQIAACKEIIGSLTQQAGIERAGRSLAADLWLSAVLARWRTLWPRAGCRLQVDGSGAAPDIVADGALEQAVMNLLNNAARSAPLGLTLHVDWHAGQWLIGVQDRGPGFPVAVLQCAGGEPLAAVDESNGIGLWLTRSTVERLGGRLLLENTPLGARATLCLPLPISLEDTAG